MTLQPSFLRPAPPKPVALCDVCHERPAQAILAGRLVCPSCFEQADDEEVRLWRKSLTVVKGGLPC